MRDAFDVFTVGLAAAAVIVTLSVGAYYYNSVFAPLYEQTRHETFKNSQSFSDGVTRNLRDLQVRYWAANPDQKPAIRAAILAEARRGSEDTLPNDLRAFVSLVRSTE